MKISAIVALRRRLVEHGEGSEEVAGAAALVGVADELRVELLVPFQRDASLLLVILLKKKTYDHTQGIYELVPLSVLYFQS